MVLGYNEARDLQLYRYRDGQNDQTELLRQSFMGSNLLLDSLKISKEAKVLVLNSRTTNMPFILMERFGYPVMFMDSIFIVNALKTDWDYCVLPRESLMRNVISYYPEIINYLDFEGTNGLVNIYRRSVNSSKQSLNDFLQVENIIFSDTVNIGEENDLYWNNTESRTSNNHGRVDKENEFGASLKLKIDKESIKSTNIKILVRINFLTQFMDPNRNKTTKLVMTLKQEGRKNVWLSKELKEYLKTDNKWKEFYFQFEVAVNAGQYQELEVYLWNPNSSDIIYDDMIVMIYE